MNEMALNLTPLTDHLGAAIGGVDLSSSLAADDSDSIQDALAEYGVIVFHDQNLTPEQQVEFTKIFGKPEINFNAKRFGVDGNPEIYMISNIIKNGKPIGTRRAGEPWHSDMSYAKQPAHATMLYAVEVPTLCDLPLGDTAFANTAAAWEALPQAMKDEIRGLKAIFDFRGRKRNSPVTPEDVAQYPPVVHPIVRTHPRTGRKSLYIVRGDCTGIVGYDQEAGDALINALADHILRPEFLYRHRWCVGDVVVWDNCTVQHRAVVDYDLPQRRLMWRTTVKGDVPV